MSLRPHHRRAVRKQPETTLFSLGAILLVLAWIVAPAPTPPAVDCELSFEPSQVQVGSASTIVQALPTEQIGDVTEVTAEEASGLSISLVEDQPLHLDVNASEAHAGEWKVTLERDDEPLCSGSLTILEATR